MKKAILLSIVLAGTLFSVKPQSYPKAPGAIRLLTYNTHYCKGGYDPGEINESNVKKLAQVIKALDADVIALQELDSASQSRGNRYLLHEIAKHTGIEYTDVYANAARFDKKGSIGCGALVRKKSADCQPVHCLSPGRRAESGHSTGTRKICIHRHTFRPQ